MIQPRLSATFCLIGALAVAASFACSADDETSLSGALVPEAGASGRGGAGNGIAGAGGAAGAHTPDAGSATDAGTTPDAGSASDAGTPPAAIADAGVLGGDAGAVLALTDGQISYVAETLNAGEIAAAQVALPQLGNSDVRDFAQNVIDDHTAARDRLLQLDQDQGITPAPSDVADALRSENQSTLDSLAGAAPSTVDALYIQLQVIAHVEAADLLEQLIDAADAEPLRSELSAERTTVQSHLDRASALNDDIPAVSGSSQRLTP